MPRNPIPEEFHDRVRELHADGYGRNRIARELGFAASRISRTAEFLGLTFDRSKIQAATEARLADLAERRSILAEDLQEDAEKLRAQLWEPAIIFSFGGKDNTYAWEDVPEPPSADKRALMATAATAIDRSLKLVPPAEQQGAGTDDAKSMLGSLARNIADLFDGPAADSSGEDE